MIPPIELPSETAEILNLVSPNFEENLNRAFKNQGIRIQRKSKPQHHPLDDVLISLADTKIELRELNLPWVPDFRINLLKPDLYRNCLDVELNLGSLKVRGSYEANNTTLRHLLPVSHVGRIEIAFHNIRATGRVGLVIKEDSLVPQNYDVTYQPSDVAVRVRYHASADSEIENEITKSTVEGTLGATIWGQLTQTLTNLLHRQLAEVVVEFSLTELLADHDEEFREYAKEQTSRAHRLLDSLLCTAKDHLVAHDYRLVPTPPFDCIYKGKSTGTHQGTFKTDNGHLSDLSTLTRTNSFSLYEDKHKLTVYGSIGLREFKHGYDRYDSQYEDVKIAGSIKAAVYQNDIFVKITVKKEGERCHLQLEDVKVKVVRDIDVDASGLGALSWLGPRLKSWVIGNLRHAVLPVLENRVKDAFLHSISVTDCVALLVD